MVQNLGGIIEIISTNGESIVFLYSPYSAHYCQKASQIEFTRISGSGCPQTTEVPTNSTTTIDGMVLSEIQTLGESAVFLTSNSDRLDLPKEVGSSQNSDRALEEIEIRDEANNQIKAFKLEHTYFSTLVTSNYCGFSSNSALGYRLKLDKVTVLDENDNPNPSSYELTYEPSVNLPDRFSDAQDHWGYYNGKTSNNTLVPELLIQANPMVPISSASGADRNPDSSFVQAGILKEIKYPTGGSSVFTYEIHDTYAVNFENEIDAGNNTLAAKVRGIEANDNGTGGIIIDEFTVSGSTQGNSSTPGQIVKVSRWINKPGESCISNNDDSIDDCFINLSIRKKGGSLTFPDANSVMVSLTDTPNDTYYFLENGIYELVLEIDQPAYQSNAPEHSHIDSITCEVYSVPGGGIANRPIGGLRIKKIKHSTSTSDPNPIVTHYEYKQASDPTKSSGVLVSTPEYTYIEVDGPGASGCIKYVRKAFSNTPLGSTQGSHIGYSDVQVYYGGNRTNGKSTYQYTTANQYLDQHMEDSDDGIFTPISEYDWKRGLLTEAIDYKQDGSTYFKVKEVTNTYNIAPYPNLEKVLHGIQFKCLEYATTGPFAGTCLIVGNRRYQVVSGWQFLSSTTEKIYDQNNPSLFVETITNFEYGNEDHIQMTKSSTTNSDGSVLASEYFYPEDYSGVSGSHPVAQLKDRFMHSYSIEELSTRNNLVIEGTFKEYQEEHGNIILREIKQAESSSPFTYTPPSNASGSGGNYISRVEFTDYGQEGNILEFNRTDEAPTAIIWDKDNFKPIAQALHAYESEIAYTSFEDDNDFGNWIYSGTPIVDPNSKTGQKIGNLSTSSMQATITVPTTGSKKYIVSYWKQGSPAIVNGSSTPVVTEASGLWTYYEHHLSFSGSGTQNVFITGLGLIDELRLHPFEAKMTTYCYDEAFRIHTTTDANSRSAYYIYDEFSRLQYVKDQDGNYVQSKEYNFRP